jgi:hypothetical protein
MARPQLIADPEVDAQVAEASDLFLANRLIEALAALDETLARSAKRACSRDDPSLPRTHRLR